LRCWIARVNLPDAEPWEVIAEGGRPPESRRTRPPLPLLVLAWQLS
jgi:hypothetical protein